MSTDAVRRVLRAGLPGNREVIEIETSVGTIVTVYVSRTGRSVRVFKRKQGKRSHELKVVES